MTAMAHITKFGFNKELALHNSALLKIYPNDKLRVNAVYLYDGIL